MDFWVAPVRFYLWATRYEYLSSLALVIAIRTEHAILFVHMLQLYQWPFSSFHFLMFHNMIFVCSAKFVLNKKLAPALGLPLNPEAAAEAEKILSSSLSKIESFWLKGSGRFLVGSNQPSIADISLVCEIMELEVWIDWMLTMLSSQLKEHYKYV